MLARDASSGYIIPTCIRNVKVRGRGVALQRQGEGRGGGAALQRYGEVREGIGRSMRNMIDAQYDRCAI